MMLLGWIDKARRELGLPAIASLAFIGAAAAFNAYQVAPLQAKNDRVAAQLARTLAQERASDARLLRDAAPAAKLAAFYRFFQTAEQPTDWLARLDAVAKSAGVELRSADYRQIRNGSRIARYEILVPLSGSYGQIRAFLQKALEEIPVLSLDQVNFRRNRAGDATVQAEARLTLHIVMETAQ